MIIGIDGNEANVQSRVGISEYAFQLLLQFEQVKSSRRRFKVYLKDDLEESLPIFSGNWNYRILKPGKLWTQWRLPLDLYLHKPHPDVFFSPTHYAPRFSPVPTVISIMDLSYLYFPEMFTNSDLIKLRQWTAYSVKNAARVLTISNSTRNDIIKEYKVPEEKVITTYLGIKEITSLEPRIYDMNQLKAKYDVSDNYILFVGTLQPRKNIVRLIEAFSQVLRSKKATDMKNLELVIIGKKGWLYEEILDAPEKFGVESQVKFLDSVSDEELGAFYKNARCFVLPSLYEGFGLPVLEAMNHDCPVITSKVSSLPEAGGDAALYIDPEKTEDIAKKIEEVLGNEKLRHEMIAKGKKQVAKFSWEKTARETLKVLEEVANK